MNSTVSLAAPGLVVTTLPQHMRRLHVGTCEFPPDSDAPRESSPALSGTTAAAARAVVHFPDGHASTYAARRILLEAYGFLAVSCSLVPSIGADSYSMWGERLAPVADLPPIDLIAIEPQLRATGFFAVEDELFRVHADAETGKRLKASLGWLGAALHAFDSPAEPDALINCVIALLRPSQPGATHDGIDAILRKLNGWDGWTSAEGTVAAPSFWAEDEALQELVPHLRRAAIGVLEQSLAAGDYARDYSQMMARLTV